MKISIGTNIKEGPWGGGNLFAINLKNYLVEKGHTVVHSLNDNDIDIILITEPRRTSESSAFTHIEVLNYLSFIKKDTLVVHRLNECDERKNTNYVNKYLLNWNKGFEYYILLDSYMEKTKWKDKIEFTYIGNIPKNVKFKNSKLIAPLAGQDLAKEIKKNHLYITGSANEPSGNHHIEAAQCGLPILYLNSGGIPEYCEGFGIMFNNKNDFEEVLTTLKLCLKTFLICLSLCWKINKNTYKKE
jgi:hypothetical protein